jgi:hypothetical protein
MLLMLKSPHQAWKLTAIRFVLTIPLPSEHILRHQACTWDDLLRVFDVDEDHRLAMVVVVVVEVEVEADVMKVASHVPTHARTQDHHVVTESSLVMHCNLGTLKQHFVLDRSIERVLFVDNGPLTAIWNSCLDLFWFYDGVYLWISLDYNELVFYLFCSNCIRCLC